MLTSIFKFRLRELATNNGVNVSDFSDIALAKFERDFVNQGGTDEELHAVLLQKAITRSELDSFWKSICLNCGKNTLVHEGGCEVCRDCGYSRCG